MEIHRFAVRGILSVSAVCSSRLVHWSGLSGRIQRVVFVACLEKDEAGVSENGDVLDEWSGISALLIWVSSKDVLFERLCCNGGRALNESNVGGGGWWWWRR